MLEIRTANALIGNQRPHQAVKHYSFTSYCDSLKQGVTSAAASALSTHTINVTQFLDGKMLLPATSYHPLGWTVHSSPVSRTHMSTVRCNVFFCRNSRMDGYIRRLKRLLQRVLEHKVIKKLGIRHKDF